MHTCSFEKERDLGEWSNESNSFNSDFLERNISLQQNEAFFFKPKRIPIKIILSDNEEVISTKTPSEQFEFSSSLNNSPGHIQNFTESFIKFSNGNVTNILIGNFGFF